MTYSAPTVTSTGPQIPTFLDVENFLKDQARTIFGDDIYLEADSQDGQLLAVFALALYNTMLAFQLAYYQRSPSTAIGVGLDTLVAINGIARQEATPSLCQVTLTGTPLTIVYNGVVRDDNNNLWTLPTPTTIGSLGTVTVTATCQTLGAITALAGQLTTIETPTAGWTSVTNATAATPGLAEETDAELRARQKISVANPSQALTTGILGGVYAVDGLVSAQLYENDTSTVVNVINRVPSLTGYPPHSISVVVDGGTDDDVANAIAVRKTPGCFTNGTTLVNTVDRYGVVTPIRFTRASEIEFEVEITIKALNNYTSAIGDDIKEAIQAYFNELVAGNPVIVSEIWAAATSVNISSGNPYFSVLSVTVSRYGDVLADDDITMYFEEKPVIDLSAIDLLVT